MSWGSCDRLGPQPEETGASAVSPFLEKPVDQHKVLGGVSAEFVGKKRKKESTF